MPHLQHRCMMPLRNSIELIPKSYYPSNKKKKLGDLLLLPEKKKKEMQKSSVVFIFKQDLYWLHY